MGKGDESGKVKGWQLLMPVDSSLLVARFGQIWGIFNSTTRSLQIRKVLQIFILSIDELQNLMN